MSTFDENEVAADRAFEDAKDQFRDKVDVQVDYDGMHMLGLTPLTDDAKQWFEDNVDYEPEDCLGDTVWMQSKFADMIIEGLLSDGFIVD